MKRMTIEEYSKMNNKMLKTVATVVWFSKDMIHVRLLDGREIGAPLGWFPKLRDATDEQRTKWQLIGKGIGISWEDIDEDISIESLLS